MANMQSLKQTRDVVSKSSGGGAIRVHCPRSVVFLHVSVNSSAEFCNHLPREFAGFPHYRSVKSFLVDIYVHASVKVSANTMVVLSG